MVCCRCPKEYRYYESALKKKCFKKLKDNVWERKTKWILLKKAHTHYRLKLLHRHFNFWILYLYKCFKKKINIQTAEAFYEERLKSKGLLALMRNVERTWILIRICWKKFEWNLMYTYWHQWKHYTEKRVKVREIKILANRIREERLRIRCLYLWSFRFKEKRFLQNAYVKATVKHDMKLKEKYFSLWKVFTEKRICKMEIRKSADIFYKNKIKKKFIGFWKRYIGQKKRYKYHMKIIQEFYENYLLKNYLYQWVAAYEKVKVEQKIRNNNLAEAVYRRKLLNKSFRTFRKMRETKRAREEKMEKFREIYVNIYVSFYLNLWLEKSRQKIICDHLEDKATHWREDRLRQVFLAELSKMYLKRLEEKEEMASVIKYSDAIITHRAFRGWLEVTDKRISKRIKVENTSKLYFEKLRRKTFDKWKEFWLLKSRKKMAIDYYRNLLLSRIVDQWKVFLTEQKMKLTKAKHLERRLTTRMLINAFESWRGEVKNINLKLNAAVDFYEKAKMSGAFRTWKKNACIKTAYKSRLNRNKVILDGIIIKDAIFRWHEMYLVKQSMKRKMEGLRFKREKQLMSFQFKTWHGFVEKMKSLQQSAETYPQIKSKLLVEEYLVILSEAVKAKRSLKRKEELAERSQEKLLKRKYLRKWLYFICWKRERILKCMTEERKCEPRKALEFFIPIGKTKRRQPVIPKFLSIDFELFEDKVNEKTFRLAQPVNKKLPIFNHKKAFAFF